MQYLRTGILCWISVFSSISTCLATDVSHFADARAYSMGNILSVLPGFANPASFGFEFSRSFSLQYTNRYGLKELSTFAGTLNYPNKYLNAGLYVSRFGLGEYHETWIGTHFYKRLTSYLSLGIRVNYFNLHYSDKESPASAFTGDIGLLIIPFEPLSLSVLAINPMCSGWKDGKGEKENLPALFMWGVSYRFSDAFLITSEVEKELKYKPVVKVGFEYEPLEELSVRIGMFTAPFTPSFGVGLHLKPFKLDLAFSKHPVLGFRSCCGIQFDF